MSFAVILFAKPLAAQIRPQVTPKPAKPERSKPAPQPVKPKEEPPPTPQPERTPQPPQIIIETSPGAEVYLDERFVGRAGGEGRLVIADAPAGDHSLRISLAGKREFRESITLAGGEERILKAPLVDLPAALSIRAVPEAQVYVDGQARGRTDSSGRVEIPDIPPGSHQVRITAPGMEEWRSEIVLRPGERRNIGPELKEAPGRITLQAPEGAEVYLDGVTQGKIDPQGRFEIGGLQPGERQIRLALKGFEDWEQKVAVAAGSSVDVTAEMQRKVPSYGLHGTLTGHSRDILGLAFSPDGFWLVSGSRDGSVRLWEVPRAAPLRDVISASKDDPESVYSLAFSPDGRLLVTGQRRLWWRNQLRFWQVGLWEETKVSGIVRTIYSRVSALAFSHDARVLAAHIDGDVRVWEMASGREVLKLDAPIKIKAGQFVLGEITFSPDDSLLASGGRDVVVWKMPGGNLAYRIPEPVKSLAFSPDGRLLACSGTSLTLRDAPTGKEIRRLSCGADVGAVAFSPDGRTVAGGCNDGVVKTWDSTTGKELQTLLRHAGSVSIVTISKDGKWLASAGADNVIRLWRLQE